MFLLLIFAYRVDAVVVFVQKPTPGGAIHCGRHQLDRIITQLLFFGYNFNALSFLHLKHGYLSTNMIRSTEVMQYMCVYVLNRTVTLR
jgi:hypothetical protein